MIKMAEGKMTELSYQECVGEQMEKSSRSNCWEKNDPCDTAVFVLCFSYLPVMFLLYSSV